MSNTESDSLFTTTAMLGDRFATSTTTPQCVTIMHHSLDHDDMTKYLQNDWPAFISRFIDGAIAVA